LKKNKLNDKSPTHANPAEKAKDIYSRAIKEAIERQLASIRYAAGE
jgi:hypothetical protein